MGGLLPAAVVALLMVTGTASAVGDLIRSSTTTEGAPGTHHVVVQVHCGGSAANHGAEMYVDGERVTPDETGTKGPDGEGRTALGDMIGDGRMDDNTYGNCHLFTVMRMSAPVGSGGGNMKTVVKDFACAMQSIRDSPMLRTDPTNYAAMQGCGGPASLEKTWDSQRKSADDRVPGADPAKDNTPADLKELLP